MANTQVRIRSPKGSVGVTDVVDAGELSGYTQGSLSGFGATSAASFTLQIGGSSTVQDVAIGRNPAGESELFVGTSATTIPFIIPGAPGTPGQSRTDALVLYKDPFTTTVVNNGLDVTDYAVVAGTPATTGSQVPPTMATIRSTIPTGSLKFVAVIGYVTVANGAGSVTTANFVPVKAASTRSPLVVASSTERDALVLSLYEGLQVYRADTDATEIYDGSAWLTFDSKWQTYTPDVYSSNILWTKGNGSASGRYFRTGKKLDLEFLIGLGSTTSYNGGTSTIEITLPTGLTQAANLNANTCPKGRGRALKSAVGEAVTDIHPSGTLTRIQMWTNQYITTNQGNQPVTPTSPFTSANGDVFIGTCSLVLA